MKMTGVLNEFQLISTTFLIVSYIINTVHCEVLLQTITESIGPENYTYYKISRQGALRLQLESLVGDADLYISDQILRPTYDDYEQQSITCGLDVVEIPPMYDRPVGVAVYGHPSQLETVYKLSVYFISDENQKDYEYYNSVLNAYPGEDSGRYQYQPPPRYGTQSHQTSNREEEGDSVLWTVIMTILKVIFEVLL